MRNKRREALGLVGYDTGLRAHAAGMACWELGMGIKRKEDELGFSLPWMGAWGQRRRS